MTLEAAKKAVAKDAAEAPRTLQQLLKLRAPNAFKTSGVVPYRYGVSDPALLYGVELEIEHCEELSDSWYIAGMEIKEDGSLRNTGREFVTAPASLSVLATLLDKFFVPGRFTERNYSDRCSVHVHCNAQDLTPDQLAGLVLVYQIMENVLFAFIGDDRKDNIFCVPLSQTNLTYRAVDELLAKGPGALRAWQKYTALNLTRLFDLGTVEFRHMAGTPNAERILLWCNIIGCMFRYVRENTFDDVVKWVTTLNTSSEYRAVLDAVFKDWAGALRVPDFEEMLADGVLTAKYLIKHGKDVKKSLERKYSWEGEYMPAPAPRQRVPNEAEVNVQINATTTGSTAEQYAREAFERLQRIAADQGETITGRLPPQNVARNNWFAFTDENPAQF